MDKMVSGEYVYCGNDLFSFLNPSENDMLYDISNSDKLCLRNLMKQYYLELRKNLGISKDVTFGLEIEFESLYTHVIEKEMMRIFGDNSWCMVPEDSILNGAEINSSVLTDSEETWDTLDTVCNIVRSNANICDLASGHIHIGTQILGNNPKYWRNFALLWSTYENIIFRFLYGEYISHRSVIEKYAMPISKDIIDNLDRIEERSKMTSSYYILKLFDLGDDSVKLRRRKSVNFTNVTKLQPYMYNRVASMNTVEYRSPNGTFDSFIWQNNVNLIVKLMLYCKSDKFNEDVIRRRMKQVSDAGIPSNIYRYSRIYYDQAFEFADLIFDNNLDKIYFLRQYIKDGMVSSQPLVKSEGFTRKREK